MNQKIDSTRLLGTGTGTGSTGAETVRAFGAVLSPHECALARVHVSNALTRGDWDATRAALTGDVAADLDRARFAAAASRVARILRWAERVGCAPEGAAERASTVKLSSQPNEARRMEERAAIEAERSSVSAELQRMRSVRREIEGGERSPTGTAKACALRAEVMQGAVGPIVGPLARIICKREERDSSTVGFLASVAARAEAQARKWVRGSQTRTAARKEEIGGASAADDTGAYHVRVEQEVCGIFRGEALPVAIRYLESLSVVRHPRLSLNPSRLILLIAPQIWKLGRAAAEAWEYSSIKGRDGREVGGGWALQGAVHGLCDFAIWNVDGFGADCADVETCDAEELPPVPADAVADLPALGHLRNRPDAGEGSGLRPSTLAALDNWAGDVRNAFAARVAAAATGQAAAKSRAAAAESAAFVVGLMDYARGGLGPDPESIAPYFDESGALSGRGRERLSQLRKRAGISMSNGPAEAKELHKALSPSHPSADY